MEEWLIKKRFSEDLKIISDTIPLLNPNQERLLKVKKFNKNIFIILCLLLIFILLKAPVIMGNDQKKARPPTDEEIKAQIKGEIQKTMRENEREKI